MNEYIIEQKANNLLESLKYNGGELDILNAVQTLGFVVGIASLPSNDKGFILINHSKERINHIIGVPTNKAIVHWTL